MNDYIKLNALMEKLKAYPESDTVYNPFKPRQPFFESDTVFNPYNTLQYLNLYQYLKNHLTSHAEILCIGEASGYKGCRMSGIPFTSGYILANSSIYTQIRNKFQYDSIQNIKENSAKTVYEFFEKNPLSYDKMVLWNIFPFHPHKINEAFTNRTPSKKEIAEGVDYVIDMLNLFQIKVIYCIGNSSFDALSSNEIFKNKLIIKLRHPSYGGKTIFLQQLKDNWVRDSSNYTIPQVIEEKKPNYSLDSFLKKV